MRSTARSIHFRRIAQAPTVAALVCAALSAPPAAAVDLDGFRAALRAEVGTWDGECTSLSAEGPERFAASFTIRSDAVEGHRFEGRYGGRRVEGRSRLVGVYLEERLDGRSFGHLVRIEDVRYDGPEDYRYVTVDPLTRPPTRSVVTRRGATQSRVVTRGGPGAPPVERCAFEKAP